MYITPAILTDNADKFWVLVESYMHLGFKTIDIDICEKAFVGNQTLDVEESIKLLLSNKLLDEKTSFGWDLMVRDAEEIIKQIQAFDASRSVKSRINVHSKGKTAFLENVNCVEEQIGVAVDGDETLYDISFYQHFYEVQLMTIISGKQGQKFMPEVLDKVHQLRRQGFERSIALDGGINLLSAPLIASANKTSKIDRLSVGSYFQNSKHLMLDKKKLEQALME